LGISIPRINWRLHRGDEPRLRLLRCMSPQLAHRDILRVRSDYVAFGVKRTFARANHTVAIH
jgi:hypothetical protein